MHLIKVDAIGSTNSFAREMFRENPAISPTCVLAYRQFQGRGQRGTSWQSEPGKNLTISLLYPNPGILPEDQFLISAAVSTGLLEGLRDQGVPALHLKWPNDIMAGAQKLGGILIENVIVEGKIAATIVGIGLNVNQKNFDNLPLATSMLLKTGKGYEVENLLHDLLPFLEEALRTVSVSRSMHILERYSRHLFRLGLTSTFQRPDGRMVTGIIKGVTPKGKLILEIGPGEQALFDLKEISLLY